MHLENKQGVGGLDRGNLDFDPYVAKDKTVKLANGILPRVEKVGYALPLASPMQADTDQKKNAG